MTNKITSCWILTEQGLKGTENQCLALARAAGFSPVVKTIKLRQPWKFFTPWLRHFSLSALVPGKSELAAPWPDILIASGRKAIAAALWIKRQSRGHTKLVIVQSPVIHDKNFDLVIVPQHDDYHGAKVLQITGALSLVTPETLAAAKAEFASVLEPLPGPRLAVLIGGNSRTHKITMEIAQDLVKQLKRLQAEGYSLMITASRRTPQEIADYLRGDLVNVIPDLIGDLSHSDSRLRGNDKTGSVHFFDGTGLNPYQAYLAWADAILVTEDSVSMASEAISTGKPVYIIKLQGGSKRFKRFHDHLIAKRYAQWFEGKIEKWEYRCLQDLLKSVEKIQLLDMNP